MANRTYVSCKICGATYPVCATARRLNSWRLIACSPDCYEVWLNKVEGRVGPPLDEMVNVEDIPQRQAEYAEKERQEMEALRAKEEAEEKPKVIHKSRKVRHATQEESDAEPNKE